MRRTPCEFMMWNGLPVIRREIANSMINNFGINQKETAKKLEVTPAAICQYMSHKRGKIKIIDKNILKEIDISAQKLIEDNGSSIIFETCRICKIIRSRGIFSSTCDICENEK